MKACRRCSEPIPTKREPLALYCSAYCRGMYFHERTHDFKSVRTDRERFEENLAEPDANGCIVWTGALFGDRGYGAFWLRGKTIGAHRAAYMFARGDIPDGMLVRHKCDNRPCVNIDHLELGTHADNARDAVERGRKPMGEHSVMAKLTDAQVAEIRALLAEGRLTQGEIARRYGVTQTWVWAIAHGKGRRAKSASTATGPTPVELRFEIEPA